jgi:hypothetical protein
LKRSNPGVACRICSAPTGRLICKTRPCTRRPRRALPHSHRDYVVEAVTAPADQIDGIAGWCQRPSSATIPLCAAKFPVLARKFRVLQNIFPVNPSRELSESHCGTVTSGSNRASRGGKIAKFPVKFPVGREFARRRVRSALRRQGETLVRTATFPSARN